jgi:hypothetical protein
MFFEVELTRYEADGVSVRQPRVKLRVLSRFRDFAEMTFKVDTGADLAAIPIPLADLEGIGYGRHDRGTAHGLGGSVRRYQDALTVRLGGVSFVWPCLFYEAPRETQLLPVLGCAGLLDDFDVCVGAKTFTLTRRGSWSGWLRRLWPWRRVWRPSEAL